MKGWGPKSSVCPSKSRESNFFGGISRDFAGISRKAVEKFEKKCFGSILVPYQRQISLSEALGPVALQPLVLKRRMGV